MIRRAIPLATALALLAPAASAQSPADFLPREPGATLDPQFPVSPPDLASETGPVPPPGAADPGPRLVLRGIALEGVTAIPEAELAPIWADLIGQEVSLDALDAVAARIGAAYRARGYVLSQAALPEQSVDDGVVRIQVIEGFIDRVALNGGAPIQQAYAATLFEPTVEARPLSLRTLERAVLLSRDTIGGGVETVVEPSPDTFGAADLTVLIEPDPLVGFAAIDNRGSRLYGAWTIAGGASAFNLLGLNERLDLLVAVAPEDGSLAYGQLRFDAPLAALSGTALDGARLEIEADVSRADPDFAVSGQPEDLAIVQNESNARVGLFVPFIRSRSENLFGRLALDWQDSESVTVFTGPDLASMDRLLVLEARAIWDVADSYGGVSLVDGSLRQGLPIGTTEIGADGPAAGVTDFTVGALTLSRLQSLGDGPWALYGKAIGQYAANVLPNSERFSLGDATIGRGFAPGNTTGDSGYGGRLELRRGVAVVDSAGLLEATELYGFVDYGRAYDRSLDRDGDRWQTLASAGIGARIDVRDWLTITPEIARQLQGVATDTTDPDHETRFYIGAVARF
jgi:hemolysin activation/secretion protein